MNIAPHSRRAARRLMRACLLALLLSLVLPPMMAEAAEVTYLVNPAQVKRKGESDWRFLNLGDKVFEGDAVRTGTGARLELSITPKRQFRIGQATEILLENLNESRPETGFSARIKLLLGRFWGSLRKPLADRAGERFDLATETATIGVKGTTFGVDYDKKSKETAVAVVTGLVGAQPPELPGARTEIAGPREVAPPRPISREAWTRLVKADQKLIIRPGEVPETAPLTDEDKKDPWVAFNIARDNQ